MLAKPNQYLPTARFRYAAPAISYAPYTLGLARQPRSSEVIIPQGQQTSLRHPLHLVQNQSSPARHGNKNRFDLHQAARYTSVLMRQTADSANRLYS